MLSTYIPCVYVGNFVVALFVCLCEQLSVFLSTYVSCVCVFVCPRHNAVVIVFVFLSEIANNANNEVFAKVFKQAFERSAMIIMIVKDERKTVSINGYVQIIIIIIILVAIFE